MPRLGQLIRLLILTGGVLLPVPVVVRAEEPTGIMRLVQRPEDQALVVTLMLNRFTSVGDNIVVYRDKDRLLVPLNGIMTALEIAITADPDAGKASGFFISEDRHFDLDLRRGTAIVAGKVYDLPPGSVERQLTDIYVDSSLLTQWFSIRLHLNTQDLSILVSSVELLPVEERLERERRRSGVRRPGAPGEYQLVEPPAPWFDWPFVDTTIQYSTNRDSGHMLQQGQFTSIATGIVGGLDLDMAANGVVPYQSGGDTLRATLGRRDPRGGLLGPLDAKEFLVGDVSSPTLPLVADSVVGRGGTVSTFPLHRLSDLQRVTLRGELPVGWEVELYRGSDLIDFQTSGSNGRYEFLNVPTIAGLNAFKLVFYGPEGQRREEEQPIYVSAASVAAGEAGFRLLVNQQNTDLLGNHPNSQPIGTAPFNRFDLLTRNQLLAQPSINNGAVRAIGEGEYGLSDTSSINAAISTIPLAGTNVEFAQTGLRSSLLGVLTTIDAATSSNGGVAYGGGVQSQWHGVSWLLSHDRFQHFVSENSFDTTLNEPLLSTSVARVNGFFPGIGLGRMPFFASATYNQGEAGTYRLETIGRISTVIDRYTLGAETQADLQSGTATQTQEIFRLGTQFGRVGLRGEAVYALTPEAELSAARITSDFAVQPNLNLRLGVTRLQTPPAETQFTAGAAVLFPMVALGADTNVSDRGDFSVLLKLSFGFGVEPRHDRPVFRSENFARTGAVSPLVFLDRDGDGKFGPGDVPLPDVRFRRGEGSPFRAQTDGSGTALLTGLEPYQETPVTLDLESLEDPFWKPADQHLAVMPRPGQVVPLEFPVYETGEVDGAVELDHEGQHVALPGIRLEVIDAKGKMVAQTLSGYDGSFFLQSVPLGHYTVRADADQLARLHLTGAGDQAVTLTRDNPVITLTPLTLVRAAAAAETPADAPAPIPAPANRP